MSEERIYYRHVQTGDRGYLVHDAAGKPRIRRDSGVGEYPFNEHEWIIAREERPLTGFVTAHAAFEADKVICRGLGLHRLSGRDWRNLTDEQRLDWTENGPGRREPARYDAWVALVAALRKYSA